MTQCNAAKFWIAAFSGPATWRTGPIRQLPGLDRSETQSFSIRWSNTLPVILPTINKKVSTLADLKLQYDLKFGHWLPLSQTSFEKFNLNPPHPHRPFSCREILNSAPRCILWWLRAKKLFVHTNLYILCCLTTARTYRHIFLQAVWHLNRKIIIIYDQSWINRSLDN